MILKIGSDKGYKMARKYIDIEYPMTLGTNVQGPEGRYRRLRFPSFTAEIWTAKNPLLQKGEIGHESDTSRMKVGDGVTYWNDLDYIGGLGGDLWADNVRYENQEYPDMENLQDAMDVLLYTAPSVRLSGGGSYEIGSTIQTVNLSWTWNKKITNQSIDQGIGELDPETRSYVYNKPITTNTTFKIVGGDGKNTATSSTSVSFMPKRYWGVSAKTSLTDADILGLSSELSTSRTQSRTFDCSGGKYFYLVIRTDYCSGIKFKVGGLAFSDMIVETRSVVNAQGFSQSYNIYRVNNIQTGSAIAVEVL